MESHIRYLLSSPHALLSQPNQKSVANDDNSIRIEEIGDPSETSETESSEDNIEEQLGESLPAPFMPEAHIDEWEDEDSSPQAQPALDEPADDPKADLWRQMRAAFKEKDPKFETPEFVEVFKKFRSFMDVEDNGTGGASGSGGDGGGDGKGDSGLDGDEESDGGEKESEPEPGMFVFSYIFNFCRR